MRKKKKSFLGIFTTRRWVIYMIIPTIYLLILTVFVVRASLYTNNEAVVGYNEVGNVDYKVYLKDNNFYNSDYLEKNMQYIASLIDYVDAKFEYEIHSTEKMDYKYKYNIKADLLINDPNDNNKLLYKKTTVLVPDKELTKKGGSFKVDDKVKLDYNEYNDYVNNFKRTYALSVKSRLLITMEVSIDGKSNVLKEDFDKTNKLMMSIPLSEQTIDIGIDTSDIKSSGSLEKNILSLIKKPVLFGAGCVTFVVSLVLLYYSLYTLFTSRTKKDIYKSTIKRILRDYDRAIVSGDSMKILDDNDGNIIEVANFNEMLDAHDALGLPILYNEVTENELSYFVISSSDILYKYVVDRQKLEEEERERILKKNKELEEKFSGISKLFKRKNNKKDL